MNVVARKTLEAFWIRHPRAKGPLTAWYDIARAAEWRSPQDVRNDFNTADFVGDNRALSQAWGIPAGALLGTARAA